MRIFVTRSILEAGVDLLEKEAEVEIWPGPEDEMVPSKEEVLINTSRGPMIDEKALVKALQERRIAGAELDVYGNEPELAPGLMECENVVLLPHLKSAFFETQEKMTLAAATNALALLNRKKAPRHRQPRSLRYRCLLEENPSEIEIQKSGWP